MMRFTNGEQLYELFLYAGCGFWLCLFCDLFRIWRRLTRPSRIKVFVLDIVLCVSEAVLLFLFGLTVKGASLRLPMLLCAAGGFLAARLTVSRLLMALTAALLRGARAFRRLLAAPYARFCRAVRGFLKKYSKKREEFGKKVALFSKKGLPKANETVYNKEQE